MVIEDFQKEKTYAHQYYLKNREHLIDYGKQYYQLHRDTALARSNENYHKNLDINREKKRTRIALWRAINREANLTNERKRYQAVKEQRKLWRVKNRVAGKLEVLTHYGNGKCACVKCGESRLACLSIDHINGRGKEDRGKRLGIAFYRHLRRNNYPSGYQTLCMNCQFVKRIENNEYYKIVNKCLEIL